MKSSRFRMSVQIGFLLFLTWVGMRHQMLGGGPEGAPAVDALCPFGGMESLYIFLTSGGWLRRVAPSALILLVAVVLMTIVSGRTFCGWICPLGTLGELSAKIGNKLGIKKSELPLAVDSKLRYLKYVIFLVIIYFTWQMGTLVWRDYDPWVAYMHLSAGFSEMVEKPWAFIILFGTVIFASFKIERFWCRYLCPLGALLAPLQKVSFIRIRRNEDHCINCHLCSSSCPVRLDPESSDAVTSAECLACGQCVEACPKEKALYFAMGGKAIKTLTVGIIGLVIFFGAYGYARVANLWQTWASPTASIVGKDPTEAIFGWMTVEQIAETLKIPVTEVVEMGKLPQDIPLDVPVKNVEGVDDEVLKENLKEGLGTRPSSETSQPSHILPPDEIKGSMTMNEIATTYGVDGKKVFEKAGWPVESDPEISIKTVAHELGKEVQEIRNSIKDLLKGE